MAVKSLLWVVVIPVAILACARLANIYLFPTENDPITDPYIPPGCKSKILLVLDNDGSDGNFSVSATLDKQFPVELDSS